MNDETKTTETPKEKLTPKYVTALAQAKALNIPLYDDKTKLYRELNKQAGLYWDRDVQEWIKQEPKPEPTPESGPAPERDNSVILSNDHHGIWIRGKDADYSICNFGIRVTHLITDSRQNAKWGIDILHGDKQTTHLVLEHDDFASHSSFHKALLKWGWVFRGGQREFNYLKEALLPQVKKAERIERLGYHDDSGTYVFVNGVFNHKFTPPNEFGIVEVGEKAFYLGYDVKLKQHEDFARFIFLDKRVRFDQVANVVASAYGAPALMSMAYYVASLWRDVAFNMNHFFPLKCLYGSRPNTGKSTLARMMTAFFGYEQQTMSMLTKNTAKSYPRTLDQQQNAVIWFDELPERIEDKDIGDMLQAAYDGGGYKRGEKTMGNETSSIRILSGVVLTGNELPRDEVLLTRWCVTVLNSQIHTDAQKAAYQKLTKLINGGLSSVTGELLRSSELIRKTWNKAYSDTLTRLNQLAKTRGVEVNERLLKNSAVILTPCIILEKAGKIHLRKAFGLSEDLETFGFNVAVAQMPLLKGKSHLNTFFEIVADGRESGKILEGRDFIISNGKKSATRYLGLRMKHLMAFFEREYRARYGKVAPHRDEIESLIETHPAFIDRAAVHFEEMKLEEWFDEKEKQKKWRKIKNQTTVKHTPRLRFDQIEVEFGSVWTTTLC